MTATPAQVANDLDAQAAFFAKSEADLAQDLRDCARAIRAMLNDGKIDGRTYGLVHNRMLNIEGNYYRRSPHSQITKSVTRGRQMLQVLHGELMRAAQ